MTKFSGASAPAPAAFGPVKTTDEATTTHEGGAAFRRDCLSDLFVLAVSNMVGEDTFYEAAEVRDERFRTLAAAATEADPDWVARFVPYLRNTMKMRSASAVLACEYVRAGGPNGRRVVDAACERPDEPAEVLGYWMGRYGRNLPAAVKRGAADAARRLYGERAALRYDGLSRSVRMGDVVELTHPKPKDRAQAALFRYLLDQRHHGDGHARLAEGPKDVLLRAIAADGLLQGVEERSRRARMRAWAQEGRESSCDQEPWAVAGWSWERLAGWLPGGMDAEAWEWAIPNMGVMACLAEGTPVWLPDGTTAPIEVVVARRLPVLAYDREWDTRPVQYGPSQERSMDTGNLVPTLPSDFLDNGVRPVLRVEFESGRAIEATSDHRWVTRRNRGRSAWAWKTTEELSVGDHVPAPLTAGYFGDEGDLATGRFLGLMIGNGSMSSTTSPAYSSVRLDGGDVAFMEEFVAKHGCELHEYRRDDSLGCRRLHIVDPQPGVNRITELLRSFEVWGQRVERKTLPSDRPFSRQFWVGVLSGLLDTDGSIRRRRNAKGYVWWEISWATTSEALMRMVSDAVLRLGIPNVLRMRLPRATPRSPIQGNFALWSVEVNGVEGIRKLADILTMSVEYKRLLLAQAGVEVATMPGKKASKSPLRGYDERVVLDRVVAVVPLGDRRTYCVTVDPSHLFVANGLVTGNCLRNLRNFDQAGISAEAQDAVEAKIVDPDEVRRSRILPFRAWTAYREAPSDRWKHPLGRTLDLATANVEALPGGTLVLVDCSGSMGMTLSRRSTIARWEVAAVLAAAMVRHPGVDVVAFGTGSERVEVPAGSAALRLVEAIGQVVSATRVGGGTNGHTAVRRWFDPARHRRAVIVTDDQMMDSGADLSHVPTIHTVNVGGYAPSSLRSGDGGGRFTLAGLSDSTLVAMGALEAARGGRWPF